MTKMKDALIKIRSIQINEEDKDETEIITEGRYELKGSVCELRYDETEATGYEGSVTSVKAEHGKWLRMIRAGAANAELFVEVGRKNYCHYATPYGDMVMGVLAKSVNADVNEDGGRINAEYIIDVNSILLGNFSIDIDIKPR